MSPESNLLNQEAVVIIPPLPEEMPKTEHYVTDEHIFTNPFIDESGVESVRAIEPEQISRLVSKEGPIPQYDVDDAQVVVERLKHRYESARQELMAGMNAVTSLRNQLDEGVLQNREAARVEKEVSENLTEKQAAQYHRAVDQWREAMLAEIKDHYDVLTKYDDTIAQGITQISEDALREFGNLRREINAGEQDVELHNQQLRNSEEKAAQLYQEQINTTALIEELRGNLEGYNATLAELRERERRLPVEASELRTQDAAEREAFIDKVIEQNAQEFEQFNNDQVAILRRRDEIMAGVDTTTTRAIKGKLERNQREQMEIQQSIISCMGLISTCVKEINRLEKVAAEFPGKIIQMHNDFEQSVNALTKQGERHSSTIYERSAYVGPVARGEAHLTAEDATRLKLIRQARNVEMLNNLLVERAHASHEAPDITFDQNHDLPQLVDAYGRPIRIPAPRQHVEQQNQEAAKVHAETQTSRWIRKIGKTAADIFRGDQKQITQ